MIVLLVIMLWLKVVLSVFFGIVLIMFCVISLVMYRVLGSVGFLIFVEVYSGCWRFVLRVMRFCVCFFVNFCLKSLYVRCVLVRLVLFLSVFVFGVLMVDSCLLVLVLMWEMKNEVIEWMFDRLKLLLCVCLRLVRYVLIMLV